MLLKQLFFIEYRVLWIESEGGSLSPITVVSWKPTALNSEKIVVKLI